MILHLKRGALFPPNRKSQCPQQKKEGEILFISFGNIEEEKRGDYCLRLSNSQNRCRVWPTVGYTGTSPLSQSNGPHDLLALGLKILPPSPLHCRCANYCCQLPPQVGLWGLGSVFVTRPVFGFWNDGVRSTCMRYSMSCQERTQKWLIPNGRIFQYDKKIISRPLRKKQFKTFCDKVSFWSLLKFDNPVNLIFSCVSDHSASKVAFGDPPFFSRLICQFRTGGTCLVS